MRGASPLRQFLVDDFQNMSQIMKPRQQMRASSFGCLGL
jgi:hypothetical protein